MIMKKYCLALFILSFITNLTLVQAQETKMATGSQFEKTNQKASPDTLPIPEIDEVELDNLIDLRSQFEKQNQTYSAPVAPTENLMRFLQKDEVQLSDEAMYWVNYVRDASLVFGPDLTFQDTVIVNPIFLPLIFKGGLIPKDLKLFDYTMGLRTNDWPYWYKPDTSLFQDKVKALKMQDQAYTYIRNNHPDYFRYSMKSLPTDVVKAREIKKTTYEPEMIQVKNDADFSDISTPVKFIPERRYWTSHFESAIQFAQNYISPNWHKGGTSALNLTNREYFVYNYNKEKVKFTNELELKTNVFTAPKDTLHDYKVGDDVLRLHSNIGYKAFSKWYYTFDATVQTQLFNNYRENSDVKQAAFLAPLSMNIGIGMQYDLNKTFKQRHKSLNISANIAPLSYTFMYSRLNDDKIDLGRHGFEKNEETGEYKNSLTQFGSTINATMTFNFTRNISWYSRLYYFTNYHRMLGEFENRLNLAISRFFSTTISLNLRYDDSVSKNDEFDSYLQVNELMSFGFNYRW